MRGRPYGTHNHLKRVLPWFMCKMQREEKSQPQIKHKYYLPAKCVFCPECNKSFFKVLFLPELKNFRTLREVFLVLRKHAYMFWNMFDWSQMVFCGKKVHILNAVTAANSSTNVFLCKNYAYWVLRILQIVLKFSIVHYGKWIIRSENFRLEI